MPDYFTVAEFREVTGDENTPQRRYEDTDILETQEEVVGYLEQWAHSAWVPRTATEASLLRVGQLYTQHVPVRSVSAWSLSGTAQVPTSYTLELNAGIIRFGDWEFGLPKLWPYQASILVYDYGFTTPPRLVKSACIKATRSMLDEEEGRSKIPARTVRYSSERTDIELTLDDDIQPWPWDPTQSARMRAYWGRHRPRTLISV